MAFIKKEKNRMVFRCGKTQEAIVDILDHPRFEDNIKYTFDKEDGTYIFSVTKVPYQLGKHRPVKYRMWFEQGKTELYLLMEAVEEKSVLVTSTYEPEMYRFFIQVCECEPVAGVE